MEIARRFACHAKTDRNNDQFLPSSRLVILWLIFSW